MSKLREKSFNAKEGTVLDRLLENWRARVVRKEIGPDQRICDLGCGYNARFIKNMEDKIKFAYGFDVSVNDKIQSDKIKLVQCDLNKEIELKNDQMDIVVSLAVLEHLDNSHGYLAESYRVLKSGGQLLLTTPTPFADHILKVLAFFHLIDHDEVHDHKECFTRKKLHDIVKEAGYSDVQVRKFEWGLNSLIIATK